MPRVPAVRSLESYQGLALFLSHLLHHDHPWALECSGWTISKGGREGDTDYTWMIGRLDSIHMALRIEVAPPTRMSLALALTLATESILCR